MQSYKFAFATDRVHDGKPSPLFTTLVRLSAIIINNGCSSGPFKCYGTSVMERLLKYQLNSVSEHYLELEIFFGRFGTISPTASRRRSAKFV